MSSRSGEMARRAAMGIGHARNGAQVAQALQTLRYSALDKRRPDPEAKRSRLQAKRKDTGHLLMMLENEVRRIKEQRADVTKQIERVGPSGRIDVTDHALVRFLERVMNYDLDAVRDQIARLVPAERPEDRALYIRNGFQFVVKDRVLVTVLDGHMDPDIEEAFAVDDAGISAPQPVRAIETSASQAARTLARCGAKQRAKVAETTARLRAELGR
jgi:hypothetical protein